MNVFRSKLGPELVIPIIILLGSLALLFIVQQIWLGVAIIIIVAAFVFHTLFSTRYSVLGATLRIRCGIFFDETIDIVNIVSIKEIRNAMSSPAASLDRLEVRLLSNKTILISPADRTGFLNALTTINPRIDVTVARFK
jgi:hypothetical protein